MAGCSHTSVLRGAKFSKLTVSEVFERCGFNSIETGITGLGFCSESRFSIHGQDASPAQQLMASMAPAFLPHDWTVSAAKHDGNWESWITSPKNKAMIDLMAITTVRVTLGLINSKKLLFVSSKG